MKDFAKIFKRENGEQIVVMRDASEEDQAPRVTVYFKHKGIAGVGSFGACFTTEEGADLVFKNMTTDLAREMVRQGIETVEEMLQEIDESEMN